MWTIWRINWQIVKISDSCRVFALTSTYLLWYILQKLLSTIDIISENCRNLHLYPPTVTFRTLHLYPPTVTVRTLHLYPPTVTVRTLHLSPPTVTVIQTVTQSVQSVSARLLIYCELLYRQRRTKNSVSLTFLNICACTSNTFCEHRTLWSTIQVGAA
jgi:hypothetical protein